MSCPRRPRTLYSRLVQRTQSFLIGLALLAAWLFMLQRGTFLPFEVRAMDWRFHQRPSLPDDLPVRDPTIAMVEITDECIKEIGRWPWSREVMSRLVDRIASGRPRVVGVDIQFYEPSERPADDELLARAVARAGNVVLASHLSTFWTYDPITGGFVLDLVENEPIPVLKQAARAIGLVNIDPYVENSDGIVRMMPLAKQVSGRWREGFALSVASLSTGVTPIFEADGQVRMGAYEVPSEAGRLYTVGLDTPQPLGFEQCSWINYTPLGPQGQYFEVLKASDLLTGRRQPDEISDRTVLLGVTGMGAERDKKLTVHGLMSGVELQANVVRNLRQQNFLERVSLRSQLILLLLVGILASWIYSRLSLGWAALAAFLMAGAMGLLSRQLFLERGMLLDMVPVTSFLLVSLIVQKMYHLGRELARRIQTLERLNISSWTFNSILELEPMMEKILEALLELSGARGSLLVVYRRETEELIVRSSGRIPDRLLPILHHRRVQEELGQIWESKPSFIRGSSFAVRPNVAPDQVELFEGLVLIPMFHKDRVEGYLGLRGPGFEKRGFEEESSFWLTLASIARAAIENAILYKLATVDGLTTLFVRHFFDIEIEKTFGRAVRYQENLVLLLTDIDKFKKLNDTYGHQVGDRALRAVAQEVKRCVRLSDVACRYGGEEFAVILPATDLTGALQLAERIRARIEALRIPAGDQEIQVTISIGLSHVPRSRAKTTGEFIEEADAALYTAKNTGRNRVVAHDSTVMMHDAARG